MSDLTVDSTSPNLENTNTLVFTIGRMNPPTPGHLELIREMLTYASVNNIKKVFVFLSANRKGNDNPLLCSNKRAVLMGTQDPVIDDEIAAKVSAFVAAKIGTAPVSTSMTSSVPLNDKIPDASLPMIQWLKTDMQQKGIDVQDIHVYAMCYQGNAVFGYIDYFADAMKLAPGSTVPRLVHLVGFFGAERGGFNTSIPNHFGKEQYKNVYDYIPAKSAPRGDMEAFKKNSKEPGFIESLDMTKLPDGAISASLVRTIVQRGLTNKFIELYSQYLDPASIDKLYDAIGNGMTDDTQVTKKQKVNAGGRKTRKRIKKSRRKPRKQRKTGKKSRSKRKRSTI